MEGEFKVPRHISFSKKCVMCLDNFMFMSYTPYQAIEHRRSINARVILKEGLKDLKTNSPVMPAAKLRAKSYLCNEADFKTVIIFLSH